MYDYNYQGKRLRKKYSDGKRIEYYIDGNKIMAEYHYNQNSNTHIDDYHYTYNALGIAGIRTKNSFYSLLIDTTGSVSKVLCDGRLIGEYTYDIFGNVKTTKMFTLYSDEIDILEKNPFRWKGYYQDKESGYYLIDGRYYDPKLGMFITKAELDTLELQTIQGKPLNLFDIGVMNPFEIPNALLNLERYLSPQNPHVYDEIWFDRISNEEKFIAGSIVIIGLIVLSPFSIIAGKALVGSVSGSVVKGTIGFSENGLDDAFDGFVTGAFSGALVSGITQIISTSSSTMPKTPIIMSLVFGVSLLEANLDGIITNSEIRGAVISATFAFFSEFFQDKITTENNFIDILKDIIEEIKSEFIEEFTIKGINDYYKSKQ